MSDDEVPLFRQIAAPTRLTRVTWRLRFVVVGCGVVSTALVLAGRLWYELHRQGVAGTGVLARPVRAVVISNREGVVDALLVTDRTIVRPGVAVMRLDTIRARERLAHAQVSLMSARAQEDLEQRQRVSVWSQAKSDERVALAHLLRARAGLLEVMTTVGVSGDPDSVALHHENRRHVRLDVASSEVLTALAQVERARQLREDRAADFGQPLVAHSIVLAREAEMADARVQMQESVLRAPVGGLVAMVDRAIVRGEYIARFQPVFAVVDSVAWEVEIDVNERDAARVAAGDSVGLLIRVATSSRAIRHSATVVAVHPAIIPAQPRNGERRSAPRVRARLSDEAPEGLIEGLVVEARIWPRGARRDWTSTLPMLFGGTRAR